MAMPPTHISVLRSATDAEEPITCSISWASERDAAHHVARALDLEPGRTQPHDMGEQVAPQVADHALAQPRHQVEARARGDRQHQQPPPAARPARSSGHPAGPARSRDRSGRAGRRRRPAPCRPPPAATAARASPGRDGAEDTARAAQAGKAVHAGRHSRATPSSSDRVDSRSARAAGVLPQARRSIEGIVPGARFGRAQPDLPGGCMFVDEPGAGVALHGQHAALQLGVGMRRRWLPRGIPAGCRPGLRRLARSLVRSWVEPVYRPGRGRTTGL